MKEDEEGAENKLSKVLGFRATTFITVTSFIKGSHSSLRPRTFENVFNQLLGL